MQLIIPIRLSVLSVIRNGGFAEVKYRSRLTAATVRVRFYEGMVCREHTFGEDSNT